jgi:hypothetical protein
MFFIRNLITLLSVLLVILPFSACRKLDKEGPATATVRITVSHSQSSSRIAGTNRSFTADVDTELIALVPDNTTFNQEYLSLKNRYQFALTDLSTDTVSMTVPLDTGIKLYSYGYFGEIFTVSELENTATLAEQFGETSSFTISSGDTSKEVNLTIIDTTAPTVSSVSTTADNQSSVSTTDNITVIFSEAMDTTFVTTSTSDTNCAGTIRISSDNFSSCVRMSSEPAGSNSNKTFTLDPYDNLTGGTTYLSRVTTGVKDSEGNPMSSQYDNSTGFTTSGWMLIAKQADSDDQLFSSNARSTFLENDNDSSQSTFMNIGNLDKNSYSDSDGKYKFKLVWGGKTVDSSGINKEVSWTQTSWLTESSIQGFEEISNSGYITGGGSGFSGLGKSEDGSCVIDGNGGTSNWWNCAGAIGRHNGGIPGPKEKIASSMNLYIW